MFETLKLTMNELAEVSLRRHQLALAGNVPEKQMKIYFAACGDGSCAQCCEGGCGVNCSGFCAESFVIF